MRMRTKRLHRFVVVESFITGAVHGSIRVCHRYLAWAVGPTVDGRWGLRADSLRTTARLWYGRRGWGEFVSHFFFDESRHAGVVSASLYHGASSSVKILGGKERPGAKHSREIGRKE